MGLDMVEFVIDVEETFQLAIPDAVAQTINTPRKLIDYIHSQLPHTDERHCLSQRAFYAVRVAICRELGSAARVRPTSAIAEILPAENAREVWQRVGSHLNVTRWNRFRGGGWWQAAVFHQRPRTVGDAARQIVVHSPTVLKSDGEGWSWDEVRSVVEGLMRDNLGITKYNLDDSFIDDHGVD
jgi:hypothetical protein